MVTVSVNKTKYTLDIDPDMPLLWVLRDHIKLPGTKYGCGRAYCGACTVLVDSTPTRSCITQVHSVQEYEITTIEGLTSKQSQAVKEAWLSLDVPQCGYCQSGQIISATALLTKNPQPSDNDINQAMSGNICRCATYPRIKTAIKQAGHKLS